MVNSLFKRNRPAAFQIAFSSDLPSARAAAAAIRGFLAEHGIGEHELFSCELCLMEACNNAVEYAQGSARDRPLGVEAVCGPAQIELRVTDHTAGFTWPERVVLPSPMNERGRGLFIIQSMMDEVLYLRGREENVLIMRVVRVGGTPSPAAGRAVLSQEDTRRQLTECKRTMDGLVRELAFRSETLAMIFRWCAELGRTADTTGFESRLLADFLRLTATDWYVLRLISPDTHELTVVAASDPAWKAELLEPSLLSGTSRGIEAAVASSHESASFDARKYAGKFEPLTIVGPQARGLVWPLCFGDSLLGTLAVGRRQADFSSEELPAEVMRIFAAFLALQTVGAHQREEEVRSRLATRELEIGRKIQQALLPGTLPELHGFGLSGGWQSAREIGGDFYDAVALSDRSLLLVIADVMGKGVPAALFATHVRGMLRGLAVRSEDPAALLNRLNRLLYPELSAVNMFVTALVVVVDVSSRLVTAASAGHCPPLFTTTGRRTVSALPAPGIPLGILPDTLYHSETAVLGSPGLVFLHTDGLTEARSPTGEMFGRQRLMEWLRDHTPPGRSATELRGRLLAELNHFRGGKATVDDQAFLFLVEDSLAPSRLSQAVPVR